MDYSLVVGIDSVKNELVLGIVGALYMFLGVYQTSETRFRLHSYIYLG